MQRARFPVCVLAALAMAQLASHGQSPDETAASPPSDARPNIVVIVADDLDSNSLDVLLANGLMPSLQKLLIEHGTTFSNSFATTPLCCPSRATFLTGRYSHNHGVLDNSKLGGGGFRKFRDASTIATWLRDAGYRNGYVGKYLNEYGLPATYIPPGWDDWQALVDQSTYSVYGYTITDNGRLVTYGTGPKDYQTDVLRERSLEFLEEAEANDAQPFFLMITPLAPHLEIRRSIPGCETSLWGGTIRPAPRHLGTLPEAISLPDPPSFNELDLSDKPAWYRDSINLLTTLDIACASQFYVDRLESLRAVDDLIEAVVKTLAANGELENTVVVFTSDNGDLLGAHRLSGKSFAYEESIRVPLIIRAPGCPRQVVAQFALSNDVAPTLAELAQATPTSSVDGRSLVPLLRKGEHTPWRRRFFVEYLPNWTVHFPKYSAVRTGSTDTRAGNRLQVQWINGQRELYHLDADPHQLQSLHDSPRMASELAVLEGFVSRFRTSAGEACRSLEDEP